MTFYRLQQEFSSAPASPSFLPQQDTTEDEQAAAGPTAIVIKNIPFSLKKDDFYYLMTVNDIPTPYALNYHFDNGIFRGLAFANYKTSQDTLDAIGGLNRLELGGRRLRVELKKPVSVAQFALPGTRDMEPTPNDRYNQPRQPPRNHQPYGGQPNDNRLSDLFEQLKDFCNDPSRGVFIPQTRSGKDRKDVHMLAERFGLFHQSVGVFPDRQVQVRKKPVTDAELFDLLDSKSAPEYFPVVNTKRESSSMLRRSVIPSSSGPRQDTITSPIRQPRGPDLTKNFDTRKDLEQLSLADVLIHHRMGNMVL
ncbi:hypothetical protein [Absidia glauca]|uniref:RRM domain-containing protein n=1 Tax=Absidia glauca TaxID=4829 RepID=A0A163TCW7_ABSGL|nr:hypothetical protein [Absidia glauca]